MSCQLPPLLCPFCKHLQSQGCSGACLWEGRGLGGPLGGGEVPWEVEEAAVWGPHLTPSSLPPSYATDDDIVFEDFARLRLKGLKDEDYDDQFC